MTQSKNKMKHENIIGILGLALIVVLTMLYWKIEVNMAGHIFFSSSILITGIFISHTQNKWKNKK